MPDRQNTSGCAAASTPALKVSFLNLDKTVSSGIRFEAYTGERVEPQRYTPKNRRNGFVRENEKGFKSYRIFFTEREHKRTFSIGWRSFGITDLVEP